MKDDAGVVGEEGMSKRWNNANWKKGPMAGARFSRGADPGLSRNLVPVDADLRVSLASFQCGVQVAQVTWTRNPRTLKHSGLSKSKSSSAAD